MFILKEGVEAGKAGEGTTKEIQESIIKWLNSQGITTRTAEEDESFVKSKSDKQFDEGYSKAMTEIDGSIQKLSKVEKKPNQKTTDYLADVIDNDAQTKIADLEAKIKKMEDEGVSGDEKAKEYKEQLEKLQGEYKTLKEETANQLKEKDGEIFMSSVRNSVNKEMADIRATLDSSIKPELLEDIVQNRLNKFWAENKPHDLEGTTVFKDANGETRQSKQDGKPMNAKEVLSPYFKDLVDETKRQGGAGSGGAGGAGGQGGEEKKFERPESVKSRVGLHNHIVKDLGFKDSSKEFAEAFNAMNKDADGNPLPLKDPQ